MLRPASLLGVVLAVAACTQPPHASSLSIYHWYGSGFTLRAGDPALPPIDGDWVGSDGQFGNAGTGELHSPVFLAGRHVGLRLAGYPRNPDNRIYLLRLNDGATIDVEVTNPKESWLVYWQSLPDDWEGKAVQLVALDRRTEPLGWFAVQLLDGEPEARWPKAIALGLGFAIAAALARRYGRQAYALARGYYARRSRLAQIFNQSTTIRRSWWLVVLAALLLRKLDAWLSPFLWAEDGAVFLQEHYERGLGALVTPYAGYLHSYIRLWVLPVSLMPFDWIPRYFSLAGVLPVLVSALYLTSNRFEWPRSAWIALAIPLAPFGGECILNLVNSQWFVAMWPALVLFAAPAETRRERIVDAAMLVVAGLTGPFAIVYAPLFCLKSARSDAASLRRSSMIMTLTAAIQVGMLAAFGSPAGAGPAALLSGWADVAAILGKRVVLSLFLGADFARRMSFELATIGFVAFFVIVTALVKKERRGDWLYLAAAALVLAIPGIARGGLGVMLSDTSLIAGDRYFNVPRALLIWGIVDLGIHAATPLSRWVASLLLVGAVVTCLSNFSIDTPIDENPWAANRQCVLTQRHCVVDVAPRGWFYLPKAGWHRY